MAFHKVPGNRPNQPIWQRYYIIIVLIGRRSLAVFKLNREAAKRRWTSWFSIFCRYQLRAVSAYRCIKLYFQLYRVLGIKRYFQLDHIWVFRMYTMYVYAVWVRQPRSYLRLVWFVLMLFVQFNAIPFHAGTSILSLDNLDNQLFTIVNTSSNRGF